MNNGLPQAIQSCELRQFHVDNDSDAIRKCLDGDTDAFRTLVERYEREAIAHARTIIGNAEDSHDVVQDAFLDAFRALARFDSSREFYPWFYVILRNRCYGWLKSRKRRTTVTLDMCHELLVTSDSAAEDGTEDIAEALLKLGPEDREIILLKYIDGLKYQCLAERLEIPIGTVTSRLYHARRRLRETLESGTH